MIGSTEVKIIIRKFGATNILINDFDVSMLTTSFEIKNNAQELVLHLPIGSSRSRKNDRHRIGQSG